MFGMCVTNVCNVGNVTEKTKNRKQQKKPKKLCKRKNKTESPRYGLRIKDGDCRIILLTNKKALIQRCN